MGKSVTTTGRLDERIGSDEDSAQDFGSQCQCISLMSPEGNLATSMLQFVRIAGRNSVLVDDQPWSEGLPLANRFNDFHSRGG